MKKNSIIHSDISQEFLRFIPVGGISFIADYVVSLAFNQIFLVHYLLASASGFIVGTLVNYILSKRYVFSNARGKNGKNEFIRFVMIGIFGLGLTQVLSFIFSGILRIPFWMTRPLVAGIVLFFNFFVRRAMIFNGGEK